MNVISAIQRDQGFTERCKTLKAKGRRSVRQNLSLKTSKRLRRIFPTQGLKVVSKSSMWSRIVPAELQVLRENWLVSGTTGCAPLTLLQEICPRPGDTTYHQVESRFAFSSIMNGFANIMNGLSSWSYCSHMYLHA